MLWKRHAVYAWSMHVLQAGKGWSSYPLSKKWVTFVIWLYLLTAVVLCMRLRACVCMCVCVCVCACVRVCVSPNTDKPACMLEQKKYLDILRFIYVYFQQHLHTSIMLEHVQRMCVHLYLSKCVHNNVCTMCVYEFPPKRRAFPRMLASWCEAWWSGCLGWVQGIFPSNLIRPSNDVRRQPWVTVVKTTGMV